MALQVQAQRDLRKKTLHADEHGAGRQVQQGCLLPLEAWLQ
jgi:hypothetical protein